VCGVFAEVFLWDGFDSPRLSWKKLLKNVEQAPLTALLKNQRGG
jgi:hypothetical protein